MMYTLLDYDDEDLIVEIKERGYAVYKNEVMQKEIAKFEALKGHLESKLKTIKQLRGK